MVRKNCALKTSAAIAAIFVGAVGFSVFLATPSSAHRLGWLPASGESRNLEAVGFSSRVLQADRSGPVAGLVGI
jgi:hypothetical protein